MGVWHFDFKVPLQNFLERLSTYRATRLKQRAARVLSLAAVLAALITRASQELDYFKDCFRAKTDV